MQSAEVGSVMQAFSVVTEPVVEDMMVGKLVTPVYSEVQSLELGAVRQASSVSTVDIADVREEGNDEAPL